MLIFRMIPNKIMKLVISEKLNTKRILSLTSVNHLRFSSRRVHFPRKVLVSERLLFPARILRKINWKLASFALLIVLIGLLKF